jgi:N-methylhydantoinase A
VFTRETWLGEPFSGHHTGLASVDVRSIGAGGGSIAWIDAGGLLRVGPDSAGADPGPACYPKGGTRPTVTDAACVLGYLDPERFLGGAMTLDAAAAADAVGTLSGPLGLDLHETAAAILTVAGEHMVGAIREITINQGVDPREVTLVAGGGAAGLNIASIGAALDCPRVLVPRAAGALSAVGGQYSEIVYESGASVFTDSAAFDFAALERAFASISDSLDAFESTLSSGVDDVRRERFVEARYAHQVWTLELPLGDATLASAEDVSNVVDSFHELHERIFAVRDPGQRVEILQCRGRLVARPFTPGLYSGAASNGSGPPARARTRAAYFADHGSLEVPVLEGGMIAAGSVTDGPLIVTEPSTTIVVPPGVKLRVTTLGNYLLELR